MYNCADVKSYMHAYQNVLHTTAINKMFDIWYKQTYSDKHACNILSLYNSRRMNKSL